MDYDETVTSFTRLDLQKLVETFKVFLIVFAC